MKLTSFIFTSTAFAAATMSAIRPASAIEFIGRCGADWLDSTAAVRRIEWAYKCGHITAKQKNSMMKEAILDDDGNFVEMRPRNPYYYPSFGWPTSMTTVDVWPAPVPGTAPNNAADPSCALPSAYNGKIYSTKAMMIGECPSGCYTEEQEVMFASGYVPMKQALEAKRIDLMTLAPGSTMGSLAFQQNTVASYSVDIADAQQNLLLFGTASGGQLRVTLNHPVVDSTGAVREAKNFVLGESLIRDDGSLDPIVTITPEVFFGKAYNLAPVTRDAVTNIVVAQGFLNGSSRYQNESLKYLNRSIQRQNIPAELLD